MPLLSQGNGQTYLLFCQVIWQVGDHDFGGGRNTVLWWTSLLRLSWFSWLASSVSLLVGFVGLVCQRLNLSGLDHVVLLGGRVARLDGSDASGTATATTASTTSASTSGSLSLSRCTFGLSSLIWLAGKLDRDLSVEDIGA